MNKRRFLKISAMGGAAALAASCERVKGLGQKAEEKESKWNGVLFGAEAEMVFNHMTAEEAQHVIPQLVHEIKRLESLFSLYQAASPINEFNSKGFLNSVDPAFKDLMMQTARIYQKTEGAFDPTIQSYWRALLKAHEEHRELEPIEREQALELVDFRLLDFSGPGFRFRKEGMAVTFNGIAQGFITDRIHQMLKAAGFQNILINLGEYRALGGSDGGKPWLIRLREQGRFGSLAGNQIELSDGALAVSSGAGFRFSATGSMHHLINPKTGQCFDSNRTVAVKASTATEADALSTACAVITPEKAVALVEKFEGAQLIYDSMIS